MKFKCQNCGYTKYVMVNGEYECLMCGERYEIEEMKEIIQHTQEYIKYFINNNESLYKIHIVSEKDDINKIKEYIQELLNSLSSDLDKQSRVVKESMIADLENILQDRLPKDNRLKEYSKNLTINEIIDRATDIEDYKIIAFILRNGVEDNLIEVFKIPHKGVDFVMDYDEFINFKDTYKTSNGIYPFKGVFIQRCHFKDEPNLIRMPLLVRFIKAGLSYEDSEQAGKIWNTTNKFIHPSKENKQAIIDMFKEKDIKTEFNKYIDFLRGKKLFTKK